MADESQLDQRYFIDQHVYNCPFCNRRNVHYWISGRTEFQWTASKTCYVYFAVCSSCENRSMHLTFKELRIVDFEISNRARKFRFVTEDAASLDDQFFYSVPTSFFVLDDRIPKVLRELVTEADGCLRSNFVTGGSACARKVVYEFARLSGVQGDSYDDRIKALKKVYPDVEPAFFDTLLTIQEVTSSKVHETASDAWTSDHLRLILSALREVLHEVYVVPALRQDRRQAVLQLKAKVLPSSTRHTAEAESDASEGPDVT